MVIPYLLYQVTYEVSTWGTLKCFFFFLYAFGQNTLAVPTKSIEVSITISHQMLLYSNLCQVTCEACTCGPLSQGELYRLNILCFALSNLDVGKNLITNQMQRGGGGGEGRI